MKLKTVFFTAAALLAANSAQAALIGDFRLDGSLVNQAGGALTLTNNGGTLDATGIAFDRNQGPTISGFSSPATFSIETRFKFSEVSGYRKIIDFLNRTSDTGLYVLNGALNFYPITTGGSVFSPNTFATLVFTRDAAGNSVGYVNGVAQISFTNASLTALGANLHMFRDDFATGQGESSAGYVDYIRVYDHVLSANEVANLQEPGAAVPEPASWALMIGGFALAGAALRRRQAGVVRFA